MNVLLSIKPVYVKKIISGEKKYEFRKSVFKSINQSNRVYIYSTSPVKRIIGSFKIGRVISGSPESVWEECQEYSGIGALDYFDYYKNHETAVAISIEDLQIFDCPINPFVEFENFKAPQSFYYMKESSWNIPSINSSMKLSHYS